MVPDHVNEACRFSVLLSTAKYGSLNGDSSRNAALLASGATGLRLHIFSTCDMIGADFWAVAVSTVRWVRV